MDDFASAAMLRLVRLGLQRQGIAPAARARPPGALVPLADKRALLGALMQTHGPAVLLNIGQAVADAPDEPALLALTMARDPHDLLARWQRLEHYVHSRHRVVIDQQDSGSVVLRHVSLQPQQPPLPAEHLLVLGLLVALAEHIGTRSLSASAAGWTWQGGQWRASATMAQASTDAFACWAWAWQVRPGPVAGPLQPSGDWAGAAARVLAADLGSAWSLAALAQALGTTARSLQRQLAQQGQRFSTLLSDLRLAQSARWLAQSNHQVAEIGCLCGYADQAHFTRAFKRHSAMTPLQYRRAFVDPSAAVALPPAQRH